MERFAKQEGASESPRIWGLCPAWAMHENGSMTLSFRTALLALVVGILATALVPTAVILDRRVVTALRERAKEDLSRAPAVAQDRFANQAGARMMHAQDVATDPSLLQTIDQGDTLRLRLLATELTQPFPNERPLLVDVEGRVLTGPPLPPALLDSTRAGGIPVSVVADGDSLSTVALAALLTPSGWAGAAGTWTPFGMEEAAQLSSLTRADVLVIGPNAELAAYTGSAEPAMGLANYLANEPDLEALAEIPFGEDSYLVAPASLPGGARVLFVRSLSSELSVMPVLHAAAAVSIAVGLLVALLAGTSVASRLSAPVRDLAGAAEQLSHGDFGAPLPGSRVTEIDRLGRTFHSMRGALEARVGELETANAELADRQERMAKLQIELVQRDRLAGAAILLGQLAHEVRNPVASARNCLEILRRRLDDDDEAREFADLAIDELLRMHELAERMLDVHRPRPDGGCDAAEVARAMGEVLRIGLPEGVSLEVNAEGEVPVGLSADALKQTLWNLVQNAREAVGGEGEIRIAVRRGNGKVELVVEDSGPGVPPASRDRVFDPFFTTKAAVKGVGLGLFTTQGIVRAHDGWIRVDRGDLGGARFVAEFVVSAKEAETAGSVEVKS